MESVIVDTNILVASFVESETFHERAHQYIDGLESGDYTFHLPMLVIVEVIAAINRPNRSGQIALLARAKKSLMEWERDGKIILYPLDRNRMEASAKVAERYRLRGADAIIASLSEELDLPLKTFDTEILSRYLRAST